MSNSTNSSTNSSTSVPQFSPNDLPKSTVTEQLEVLKAMVANLQQRIAAESAPSTRKSTAEARVLTAIESAPKRRVKYADMPGLTGLSKSASDYAIEELAKRGQIVPVKLPELDSTGRTRLLLVAFHPDEIAI